MEDFELLLQRAQDNIEDKSHVTYLKDKKNVQTAESNATISDLIKMIHKLLTITMPDVQFIPDDGRVINLDPQEKIDRPFITYKVISRTPKGEIKPRLRQEIREVSDDKNAERLGEIYGQKFITVLQFNIFASVYDTADEVMEKFEEQMLIYAGYFKQKGISEMLFKQQLTDSYYDTFRQTASVRNIQYTVETEKLIVQFKEKIRNVEILMND